MPGNGWRPSARWMTPPMPPRWRATAGDRGYGPRRTREKLREKGVPQELWDAALEELPEDGGQIDRFLQGKLHGRAPEEKEKKRLTDALLRRGFPWSEIKSAWSRYGSELRRSENHGKKGKKRKRRSDRAAGAGPNVHCGVLLGAKLGTCGAPAGAAVDVRNFDGFILRGYPAVHSALSRADGALAGPAEAGSGREG